MRFAAVVKKFTFLFRGFPRRYAPLNDMMTTVLTAMTPECLLHAPFSKNKFFSLRCWANPCFSANTLKPYCSVGFFYYIFLIFIFFEHTQIKKQRAKASHQADNLTKLWQEFLSVLEMIRHGMRSVPTKQALARYCGLSLCPSYFEREECLSG